MKIGNSPLRNSLMSSNSSGTSIRLRAAAVDVSIRISEKFSRELLLSFQDEA